MLHKYGLGAEEKEISVKYLPYRDGISSGNIRFLDVYAPEEESNWEIRKCKVKKASDVLSKIINDNKIDNIILKVDVEGAEYEIFEDLMENYPAFFDRVHRIVGETHMGFERFMNIIAPMNYNVIWKKDGDDICCPFELIKQTDML